MTLSRTLRCENRLNDWKAMLIRARPRQLPALLGERFPGERDPAGVDRLQPVHTPAQARLPGPGPAEQDYGLAGAHIKVDVSQDVIRPEVLVHFFQVYESRGGRHGTSIVRAIRGV